MKYINWKTNPHGSKRKERSGDWLSKPVIPWDKWDNKLLYKGSSNEMLDKYFGDIRINFVWEDVLCLVIWVSYLVFLLAVAIGVPFLAVKMFKELI